MNFAKGGEGEPSLLSFDDARTLFHEFGHALHGMLSDVTYPILSGTRVAGDFVEFPSQLYEHWLEQPEMLRRFAVHYKTGEPMPEALLDKLARARRFNQGFATVEYTASALVDLDLHLDPAPERSTSSPSSGRSSRGSACRRRSRCATARRISSTSFPAAIRPAITATCGRRFSTPTVSRRFEEAGDIFDPDVARRLRDFVYAAGGSRDYDEAYRDFRGRPPSPAALFRKRGLEAGSERG